MRVRRIVAIPPLCKRGAFGLRRCNSCRTQCPDSSVVEHFLGKKKAVSPILTPGLDND